MRRLRPPILPAPHERGAGAAAPLAVTPANDPAYTYKTLRLNRAAFDALLGKPEDLLVLDLRRPDELGKYGGFPVYLSIQTADLQKSLSYIPRDRLIVTVSNRAHRAGAVGDILAGLGYRVVGAIGVLDYQDEGGALDEDRSASAEAGAMKPPLREAPNERASQLDAISLRSARRSCSPGLPAPH